MTCHVRGEVREDDGNAGNRPEGFHAELLGTAQLFAVPLKTPNWRIFSILSVTSPFFWTRIDTKVIVGQPLVEGLFF